MNVNTLQIIVGILAIVGVVGGFALFEKKRQASPAQTTSVQTTPAQPSSDSPPEAAASV